MLKGMANCISLDLIAVLHHIGHSDEIILAEAHFTAHSIGSQALRADGITVAELLQGILPPLVMMGTVAGDTLGSIVPRLVRQE
jgi:L-fucose mutarotase